jgi:2,3-bisphosphoglycerate-dependent phosphoglycerate mutase
MQDYAHKVVFIRHGESEFNKLNLFAGWTDDGSDLSEKGLNDAHQAGKLLKDEGYVFDVAYTSLLKRAIRTLFIIQDEMNLLWIPTYKSWRLNERHYGALQGLNKAESVEKWGEEQVHEWRRSYATPPPPMPVDDPHHPSHDPRYADVPREELPSGESLAMVIERVLPEWNGEIVPAIKSGKKVIVAAHGNSIRSIMKYLDDMSEEAIADVNIPVGVPLVYELDADMKPVRHYYLGDQEAIKAGIEAVANQTKHK